MNLNETISGLESMLFDLHPKARGIYEAISALKNIGVEPDINGVRHADLKPFGKGYDKGMTMRSKALFAIRELNRFVKNREIAEYLNKLEPATTVSDFMSALSNPLFVLRKEDRIHKITIGTGNNGVYWGSAKWLDETGGVKSEHMYIEEPKPEQIEI